MEYGEFVRASACNMGDCVELGQWQKATASGQHSCVELAIEPNVGIAMRDSKDPNGPMLHFTVEEVAALFRGVRAGEFDHLLHMGGNGGNGDGNDDVEDKGGKVRVGVDCA